jgi:hypothetical protein
MSESRTVAVVERATKLAAMAADLADALDAVATAGGAEARDAGRHLLRLRFSLARVDELKQRVARTGGVFEPARLEVAVSILDAHVMRAEGFCAQIAARLPKAAARRVTGDGAASADEASDGQSERQRAA